MTEKEIEVLAQACKAAGIDATKIKPENPFSKNGSTATMLQAAVAEFHPEQAATWRVAAGSSLSLATMAELQSGGELSAAAKSDLYQHDAQFVRDLKHQQAAESESAAKWLEDQLAATQLRNKAREFGGNERLAKERLQFEAQRDEELRAAREASAQHAQQVQQRIDQKRIQHAQMAGRLTNG